MLPPGEELQLCQGRGSNLLQLSTLRPSTRAHPVPCQQERLCALLRYHHRAPHCWKGRGPSTHCPSPFFNAACRALTWGEGFPPPREHRTHRGTLPTLESSTVLPVCWEKAAAYSATVSLPALSPITWPMYCSGDFSRLSTMGPKSSTAIPSIGVSPMGSPVGERLIAVRALPGSPAPRMHSPRFWHSEHKVRKSQCIGIPNHRSTRWAEQGDHCPYSQSSIVTCLEVQPDLRALQVTAQGAAVPHDTLGPAEKPPAPHTPLRSHCLLADLQTGPKDHRAATCCCQTRTCPFPSPSLRSGAVSTLAKHQPIRHHSTGCCIRL